MSRSVFFGKPAGQRAFDILVGGSNSAILDLTIGSIQAFCPTNVTPRTLKVLVGVPSSSVFPVLQKSLYEWKFYIAVASKIYFIIVKFALVRVCLQNEKIGSERVQ